MCLTKGKTHTNYRLEFGRIFKRFVMQDSTRSKEIMSPSPSSKFISVKCLLFTFPILKEIFICIFIAEFYKKVKKYLLLFD